MTLGRKSFGKGFTPSNCCLISSRDRSLPWIGKRVFHYKNKSYSHVQIARLIGFSRQRIGQLLESYTPDEIIKKYKVRIDESFLNNVKLRNWVELN